MRETRSLDGRWQIAFDDNNSGKERGWAEYARFIEDAPRQPIDVPACWERFKIDYEGVAWYALEFDVSKDWQDRSIRLHFDAVNYVAEVYINDLPVGYHEGGYTDFFMEIGDVVRFNQPNTLLLRVIGPIVTQNKVIDGIGRNDMPHWRGAIAGGIWQSVSLRSSSNVYTSDIFVDPDIQNNQVKVRVQVDNLTLDRHEQYMVVQVIPLGVAAEGFLREEQVVSQQNLVFSSMPGESVHTVMLDIADPELWSVDQPYLYNLRVLLKEDGWITDAASVRFGMREFVIRDGYYYLNGKRILIKSAFFEALYPTTLAAPPDEAFARRELKLAREAGFNLLRPWRKPQPPIIYDLADEMGILFVGTMPIECMDAWPTMTPYAERRMKQEVIESVRQDRNHPSIIMWEIFNEIMRPSLQRIKQRISREARYLDPSRFILDESGGFGGGAFIYPPNSTVPEQINDVHNYPGAPFDQGGYELLLSLSKTDEQLLEMGLDVKPSHIRSAVLPGRFTHVSEVGYGSLPDLEANVAEYERSGNPLTPDYRYHKDLLINFQRALEFSGLDIVYPTISDYVMETQTIHARANKQMVEAIRMNPDIAGFAIHAYTDGDWVVGAGLLDLFRTPKLPYYAAKESNQTVLLSLHTNPRNAYAGDMVNLTANVACELEETFAAELCISVLNEASESVWSESRKVSIAQGVNALLKVDLDTIAYDGSYTIVGQLINQGTPVTENTCDFRVASQVTAPEIASRIVVCDASGQLMAALEAFGMKFSNFDAILGAADVVFVNAKSPGLDDDQGQMLVSFIEKGGKVLYLDMPLGQRIGKWVGNHKLEKAWLPYNLCMNNTRGLWTPFMHVVRKHAISKGLPAGKAMDDDYVNVYPHNSIVNIRHGDPNVAFVGMDVWSYLGEHARRAPFATLGLGWQPGVYTDDRDYRGPGPVIFGADVLDVSFGKGTAVFSTLRLIPVLGRDPIADRLFMNIVEWVISW